MLRWIISHFLIFSDYLSLHEQNHTPLIHFRTSCLVSLHFAPTHSYPDTSHTILFYILDFYLRVVYVPLVCFLFFSYSTQSVMSSYCEILRNSSFVSQNFSLDMCYQCLYLFHYFPSSSSTNVSLSLVWSLQHYKQYNCCTKSIAFCLNFIRT